MKRIGVLNLTRFGDLVQTSPLLAGLRKRHPDAEIHLLVKTRFRAIAEMLPGFDRIHELDGDALARALADPGSSFLDGFRATREAVQRLAATRFDVVYNLTHSRASAALLSLLDAGERVGYGIDREGLRHVHDPWLAHMSTLVRARRLSRLNLVDVYLGAAGLTGCGEPLAVRISEVAHDAARRLLPDEPAQAARPRRLALQLGASSDTKTWSVPHYAATLRALAARIEPLRVVLVGVPSEAEAADKLVAACPGVRFENLLARTSIPELAAVLQRCELLLTGDTGTMHLSAAVGTPTCAVFVGLGTPWETAAYGAGHLTLLSRIGCAPCQHHVRCGFPACHQDVPPEWLAELLARVLRGEPIDGVPALPRADLFRTVFDEAGLLDLAPLHVRPPGPDDLLGLALRAVFLERLAGQHMDVLRVWKLAEQRHGVQPGEWRHVLPDTLLGDLERLRELGEESARLAVELGRPGTRIDAVKATGEKLQTRDEQIYEVARSEPLLAPLALSLEGSLQGLAEADLPTMALASARHYEALVRSTRQLRTLVQGSEHATPQRGTTP